MNVLVRFAPSPTGLLHVGNARTALLNALFARAHGGDFLLRFDDTDLSRSKPAYAAAIEDDLRWLGLEWSAVVRQSDRLPVYEAAFTRLREAMRIYACYETPEELAYKRNRQRARGLPPIYDRAAARLTDDQRRALEAEGRRPHWRFRLDDKEVVWNDLIRGETTVPTDTASDPVVRRADGSFLYLLPSIVDDIDLGVTHVIRGEDHVANTGAQIEMCEALGGDRPMFAHAPLLSDLEGKGLSKRLGSLTVQSLREAGVEPSALATYLSAIGTGQPMTEALSLDGLAAGFDIARLGRGTPKFDEAHLRLLNERTLHAMPFEAARPRLKALGLNGVGEAFWEAVRPNIATFAEVARWREVCYGAIAPVIEDPSFAAEAARLLPDEPWSRETWAAWTKAVGDATGRRGKALFRPLRLALTGAEHGPELRSLLPLIGRSRALARLGAG